MLKSNLFFQIFFALYTSVAVALLLFGLGPAVAAGFPGVRSIFENAAQGSDFTGFFFRAMVLAIPYADAPAEIALDYFLSFLNIGLGVFLVWKRPGDWVARLLGLAMVGTAMAFNWQTHNVVAVALELAPPRQPPPLGPFIVNHYIFHAISGAAYVHALLIFPNGKLVPRRSLWFLVLIYFLMLQEIVFPVLKTIYGRALFSPVGILDAQDPLFRYVQLLFGSRGAGLIVTIAHFQFGIEQPVRSLHAIINSETFFLIFFFGLLIPVVGVISQVYRYRAVSTLKERTQTKIVVWALALAFGAGFAIALGILSYALLEGARVGTAMPRHLEDLSARIFPPLFAVIPLAFIIAILRHRLFDIDLVINRTLVYGPLTAILAGLFAALNRIFQSVFVAITGETSDLAIVLTTLLVTMAFEPIRVRLQKLVDHRFKEIPDPTKELKAFGEQVGALIQMNEAEPIAQRLLDAAVRVFNPESAVVQLGGDALMRVVRTHGEWKGDSKINVPLLSAGARIGLIELGARRNGAEYTAKDKEILAEAASLAARAIEIAGRRAH